MKITYGGPRKNYMGNSFLYTPLDDTSEILFKDIQEVYTAVTQRTKLTKSPPKKIIPQGKISYTLVEKKQQFFEFCLNVNQV